MIFIPRARITVLNKNPTRPCTVARRRSFFDVILQGEDGPFSLLEGLGIGPYIQVKCADNEDKTGSKI